MSTENKGIPEPAAAVSEGSDDAVPQLDDSLLPKPTLRERVGDYREAIGWRQVLAAAGGAAAIVGGVFLVKRWRRN